MIVANDVKHAQYCVFSLVNFIFSFFFFLFNSSCVLSWRSRYFQCERVAGIETKGGQRGERNKCKCWFCEFDFCSFVGISFAHSLCRVTCFACACAWAECTSWRYCCRCICKRTRTLSRINFVFFFFFFFCSFSFCSNRVFYIFCLKANNMIEFDLVLNFRIFILKMWFVAVVACMCRCRLCVCCSSQRSLHKQRHKFTKLFCRTLSMSSTNNYFQF